MDADSQPEPKPLTDENFMFFGKHDGQRLGDVPMKYWRWLLEQDWFPTTKPRYAASQQRLAAYIRTRLNVDKDGRPLPRVNHQDTKAPR